MLFFCIYLSLMEFLQQLTLGKWTFTFIYFNILKGGCGCGWDTHNRRYSRENRNIRVSKWQYTRQPYLKCLICIRTRGMATIYILLKIRYFGQLKPSCPSPGWIFWNFLEKNQIKTQKKNLIQFLKKLFLGILSSTLFEGLYLNQYRSKNMK